ncbi:hypothetical protein ACFSUK_33670 [Sphingobium scionense]
MSIPFERVVTGCCADMRSASRAAVDFEAHDREPCRRRRAGRSRKHLTDARGAAVINPADAGVGDPPIGGHGDGKLGPIAAACQFTVSLGGPLDAALRLRGIGPERIAAAGAATDAGA